MGKSHSHSALGSGIAHVGAPWEPGDVVVLRYVETPTSARIVHAYLGDPAGPAGREPYLVGGEVVTVQARPYVVIRDTPEVTALYQPPGAPLPRWHLAEKRYLANPTISQGESVRLLFPGKRYDVTLFFERSGDAPWFYAALFDGDGLNGGWRDRDRPAMEAPKLVLTRVGVGEAALDERAFRGWYVNMQTPFRRTPVGFDVADLALDIVVRPDRSWYWKDADELALAVSKGACSPEFAAAIRSAGEEVVRLVEAGAPPFDTGWTTWIPPGSWRIGSIPDGWQELPALVKDGV